MFSMDERTIEKHFGAGSTAARSLRKYGADLNITSLTEENSNSSRRP